MTADSAATAQTLLQGRGELHQALSTLGVSLLRLDIGGSTHAGEHRGGSAPHQDALGRPRSEADGGVDGEAAETEETDQPRAVLGGLVDVLA